jgi:hypothetical protein
VGVSATQGEEAPLFTARRTALMAVVAVFAFCALLVLTTYATDLEDGNNGGGHALSNSAIGFSGVAKALGILGQPVLISRHRLPAGRHAGLLVETPPPEAADKDVTPMGFAGPVLVVLPKWVGIPRTMRTTVAGPSSRGSTARRSRSETSQCGWDRKSCPQGSSPGSGNIHLQPPE